MLSKGLLPESQYGFRKGISAMDFFSILVSEIRYSFFNNQSTIGFFLDFNTTWVREASRKSFIPADAADLRVRMLRIASVSDPQGVNANSH